MNDNVPARRSIESLKKEAKQWLRVLQADGDGDDDSGAIAGATHTLEQRSARTRYERAMGGAHVDPAISARATPTLRDVQLALARERGFAGWTAMMESLKPSPEAARKALQAYEDKAQALLDAYTLGTPDALERHYRLTWHRRVWSAMRSYIQLDLGKRPLHEGDDVVITLDDARYLIAIEHDFEDWEAVRAFTASLPDGAITTANSVRVRASREQQAPTLVATREWGTALRLLQENPGAELEANGQVTDDMLEQLSRVSHITRLKLGNCKALTDDGVRHLARMPQLRELDLSHTGVTDHGLEVLRELPALETLNLVMTAVTDAGIAHVSHCDVLRHLHLMWTRTGDGAIRALAGKQQLTKFFSGNYVSDDGLAMLHELPAIKQWRGGDVRMSMLTDEAIPSVLNLRGSFTDRGMAHFRGLDGLFALSIDDSTLPMTAGGLEPLTSLPNLGKLAVDAKDDFMPYIANMRVLRSLDMQDTTATDTGFVALAKSQTIEFIWGRRSHGLGTRGFVALGKMPRLTGLSTSCLNVADEGIATLPDFPSLRELMPMDVPDAGYRHIGKCTELRKLTLMYCRDTTDAATEHITGLTKLTRYFNSYTTITDRTPELLSGMRSLEHLTFDACHGLTDSGVAKLARLPHLQELRISGNAVTPAVVGMFPDPTIVHYSH